MTFRNTFAALTIAVALLATPACQKSVVVNPPAPVSVKTPAERVMLANRILSKEVHLVADITKDARTAQVLTPAQAATMGTYIEKVLIASSKVAEIQQQNKADWAIQVNLAIQGAVGVVPNLGTDPNKAVLIATMQLVTNSLNTILVEVKGTK